MGILNFLKTPASQRPALDTFRDHIAERDRLRAAIGVENAKHAPRREAQGRIGALRTQIDQASERQKYYGAQVPELADLQGQLLAAEAELARLKPTDGRLAELTAQLRAIDAQIPGALHALMLEQIAELGPEFLAAEKALREIHQRVFVKVALADRLALQHRLGEFLGWGLFGDLNISRPRAGNDPIVAHPAYARYATDPTTRRRQLDDELRALDAAAAELERKLLTEAAG